MSKIRVMRRPIVKLDADQLSKALNPLLQPLINQISMLNNTVVALVNAFNSEQREVKCDASQSCVALSQQMALNQEGVEERLANVERLLTTLLNKTHETTTFRPHRPKVTMTPEREQIADSKVGVLSVDKYPGGSWLGDPSNPNVRVKSPIREEDLLFINSKCRKPAKMALTLLDYLFSKETLAISNLSGRSKLGKKQLDPVLVHGIKCHLQHHFNISERQWDRIKHNIDSKCRTAWKKRLLLNPDTDEDEEQGEDELDGDLILPVNSSTLAPLELLHVSAPLSSLICSSDPHIFL